MITKFNSDYPVETAYKEIMSQSNRSGFEPMSSTQNEQVVLKGKRDYSAGIFIFLIVIGIMLFFVGIIIAAIYYWTRSFQKITIDIESEDTGSVITVYTEGKMSDEITYLITKALKQNNVSAS